MRLGDFLWIGICLVRRCGHCGVPVLFHQHRKIFTQENGLVTLGWSCCTTEG
mgnify:CR=1 FL=1